MAAERIKVGVARSALLENGATFFDPAALGILDATPEIDWEYLPDPVRRLTADHCAAYDVICAVSEGIARRRSAARTCGCGSWLVSVRATTRAT